MKMYPIVNLNQLIMHAVGDNLGKGVPLYRFALIFPLFCVQTNHLPQSQARLLTWR